MIRSLILILILILMARPAYAQSRNEFFELARDYIVSLGELKMGTGIEKEALSKEEGNLLSQTLDKIRAQKDASAHVSSALSLVLGHSQSSVEPVAKTAEIIAGSYQLILDSLKRRTQAEEKFVQENGKNAEWDEYINTAIASQTELLVAQQNFLQVSVAIAYLLVSPEPDQEGHYSFLNITSAQRRELKEKLEAVVGSRGQKPQEEFDFVDASAQIVMKFLNGNHKSSDQRQKMPPKK